MVDLVPIKIKITMGLVNAKKQMIYPSFNLIPAATRNNMDWCEYIDAQGTGMRYDNCCDFDSGQDFQFAMIAVPEEFATEALTLFGPTGTQQSGLVERLNDTAAETFWNEHVANSEPDITLDNLTLQSLASRRTLGEDLSTDPDAVAALDVDSTRPGKVRNHRKTWKRFKQHAQIKIKNPNNNVVNPRSRRARGRAVDA